MKATPVEPGLVAVQRAPDLGEKLVRNRVVSVIGSRFFRLGYVVFLQHAWCRRSPSTPHHLGSPALPMIIDLCYRPGRSGHRPPQVSSAMAMNSSALWKPLARAVSAASWVPIPSARPLLTA